MKLSDLLSKLEQIDVQLAERRVLHNGRTVYILTARLPALPFGVGDRAVAWYPLIVDAGQNVVPREEVEALLRHLWHAEVDFFGDNPPD